MVQSRTLYGLFYRAFRRDWLFAAGDHIIKISFPANFNLTAV
jgi:hypothetical protein